MRPSGGYIMRVDSYLGTFYPESAGDMLELQTIRKALKMAGNLFHLHVRGRGPRQVPGRLDRKDYTSYLPLRHATHYDVYIRRNKS